MGMELFWMSLDMMAWLACVSTITWPGGRAPQLKRDKESVALIRLIKLDSNCLGCKIIHDVIGDLLRA